MNRTSVLLPFAVAFAALFAGCEWTNSSGDSTWSSSYDAMNFAGTYRITTVTQTGGGDGGDAGGSGTSPKTVSKWKTNDSSILYHGSVGETVVAGSVTVKVGSENGLTFTDDGAGNLTCSLGPSGTIQYTTGDWSITFDAPPGGNLVIAVTYTPVQKSTSSDYYYGLDTSTFDATRVTAITISQTGQSLTMSFNNGIVMAGRFTSIRQTGRINEDTGAGADTYNAQFQVSSGSESKMVGTLNYDFTSHNRILDGTWTWGKKTFDVNAIGPSWTSAGASTTETSSGSN